MPELRRDPIVGRWVIIATDRARRPSDLTRPRDPGRPGLCPFCPGQEDQGGTLGLGQSAAAFGRILGPESGTWTFSTFSPAFPYVAGAFVMAVASAIGTTVRPTPRGT